MTAEYESFSFDFNGHALIALVEKEEAGTYFSVDV